MWRKTCTLISATKYVFILVPASPLQIDEAQSFKLENVIKINSNYMSNLSGVSASVKEFWIEYFSQHLGQSSAC